MNFETIPIKNLPVEKEALDDQWYDRFKEAAAFQDYEYLAGNKEAGEKQKEKFLNGELENPTLDYPELDRFDFDNREQSLLQLKKELIKNESNEIVRQLYRWKINEKLAELRMLRSAANGNDRRVSRYSRFIYGQPEKEIYGRTLFQIKKIIDEKLINADPDINLAAKKLQDELIQSSLETEINPIDFNLPQIKSFPNEKEYQSDEIKIAFEKALEDYRLSGWKVVLEKEKTGSISVSQEKKEIIVPENKKLKKSSLQALIKHEIGTHVLRRETGERSKLKLLGLGLDRYLKGEEGIATYQEQKILGTENFAGLDGHLAIALAFGVDGKKRNFREVFEILKNFYFISSEKNKSEAMKSAQDSAWNRCVRTFRGTTCQTPGACLTRDIVYREGNIGIWNVVKNNPEEIKRFSIGKYDPANFRHIWILEQLGITDKDLQELEK